MKTLAGLALVLGLTLFAALTLYEGADDVARAFASIGLGGALLIVLARFAQTALSGLAWRALLPRPRASWWTFAQLRLVRESINTLLPVAQVGGDLIGAHLLTRVRQPGRTSGGLAAASVITDLLAQTATQVVFTIIGVGLLVHAGAHGDLSTSIALGLLIMAPGLAGFWFAPRLLAMPWLDRLAGKIEAKTGWASFGGLPALRAGLDSILRHRAGLAIALSLHMMIWFVGVLEVYIGLSLLGEERPFAVAVTIESLGHAVKAAGFLIPGAWGVQEGGFIALCAAFGIASPTAIALSLVKRIPDIVCGAPGLWLWRRLEGKGLMDFWPARRAATSPEPAANGDGSGY